MRHSVLLTCIVLLGAAPAAPASTAGVQGATLSIAAGAGERNRITVAPSGAASVRVSDRGAPLRPGGGCTAAGPRSVTCAKATLTDLVVDLADQDDRVDVSRALALRARLRGGTGNDTLVGGGGPDELDGGTGRDVASYLSRTDPVVVTMGGGADDGAPGEADDLVAIEQLVGTAAGDTITGGGGAERIDGRGGDDRLDGGGGDDALYGGLGDDAVSGGPGDDRLSSSTGLDGRDVLAGGPGRDLADFAPRSGSVVSDPDGRPDDGDRAGGALSASGIVPAIGLLSSAEGDNVLPDVESVRGGRGDDVIAAGRTGGSVSGGGGTDVLVGGPGADTFDGGSGFDRILARDSRAETVRCGSEVDRVFTSGADRIGADCERTSASFAVLLAPVRRTLADGTLPVRVTCPAQVALRCVGAVRAITLRRLRSASTGRVRAVTLGAVRFNVAAGASAEVTIRVGEAGRAALARLGDATRVRLAARGRDEAGPGRPAAARLILRAR
jgi:Ca2+-binding RTX toxin-like protein